MPVHRLSLSFPRCLEGFVRTEKRGVTKFAIHDNSDKFCLSASALKILGTLATKGQSCLRSRKANVLDYEA